MWSLGVCAAALGLEQLNTAQLTDFNNAGCSWCRDGSRCCNSDVCGSRRQLAGSRRAAGMPAAGSRPVCNRQGAGREPAGSRHSASNQCSRQQAAGWKLACSRQAAGTQPAISAAGNRQPA